ncbi:MAG: hypothetical protein ABIU54_10410 [Candidatus Eisenbacteria bacterium]
MSRTRASSLALLTLAAAFLLQSGALAGWPEGIRLTLAFAALVLLPGHALLAAIGALPPGGPWLASGWALGLGVAWLGLLVLITRMLHLPFTVLAPLAALPGAALWSIPARWTRGSTPDDAANLHPLAVASILVAAALAALHCARLGTPVAYFTDSPDHIGTIRRMLSSGDAFPRDAFFLDAGAGGADPRKGLWHPCVALIAYLAKVDPLPAWRLLAALIAPLFVLNAAAFAMLIGGSVAATVGAWALLLTYGGSLGTQYLREAVFATKLADQLALATAAAVLYDLQRRTMQTRWAAVALALGAVSAHVFSAIQFGLCFGALGAGLLIRDRGLREEGRRLIGTVLTLAAVCLPYLAWRAMGAYAPNNIIHTEPQGLLRLTDSVQIISFGVLWDWMGQLWILFPLSWWAYVRGANRSAVLYLLTTSLAVTLLIFTPWGVGLLLPRLGYLLMRFVWLLPVSAAVAFAVTTAIAAWRAGGRVHRGIALWTAAVLALLLRHPVLDAVKVFTHPETIQRSDAAVSVERWQDALDWMNRELPPRSVVLSDPATSYSIPMMTRHYVSTLVDQHSSPNDSLALRRILDARDGLDPASPFARTREVVERYGITAIALNDRFTEIPRLDYWAPNSEWFLASRERLERAPAAFHRVFDTGDFVVYTVDRAALDTLTDGARPRAYVRTFDAPRDSLPRSMGIGLPALVSGRLLVPQAVSGDSCRLLLEWRSPGSLPPGSYLVAVRFDHAMPADFSPPQWLSKPARKLFEKHVGARYRFRADHLPVDGDYGVDLWQPDQVIQDSVFVQVPPDVVPGDYEVQVRMLRQPHYPNYRLQDYFCDHDYYTGLPVGTLRVTSRKPQH